MHADPTKPAPRRTHAGKPGVYYRDTPKGRRYEFCYSDSGGKLRWQVSKANSLRGAEAERGDLIARMRIRGEEVLPNRMTFEEAAQAWEESWETRSRRKLALGTRKSYKSILKTHAIPKLGRHKIQTISARMIAVSIREVEQTRPKSATVYLAVLRGVFKHAYEEGWISQNPLDRLRDTDRPEAPASRGRALEPQELAKLLDAATREPHRTILVTLAYSGLRVSEALGLTWESVDFEKGFLRVRQQWSRDGFAPLKSKHSTRDVVLAPALAKVLKEHRLRSPHNAPDARLFYLGDRGFAGWFDRLLAKLELRGSKIRRHDLRHTWGSVLIASGCDVAHVARQLGDTVETVMRVYLHEWEKAAHAESTRAKLEAAIARVVAG